MSNDFVESLLQSPVGVALLARLESLTRRPEGFAPLEVSSIDGVSAAVELVARISFGELVELAVLAGELDAGPWISDAASTVATAYRLAEARAPIAEAIDAHFGAALHAPIDRNSQEWWSTARSPTGLGPLFRNYEDVYDAGQFSLAGLWTATHPPDNADAQLVDAWELFPGPVGRWSLPVSAEARVWEVHRPSDWTDLVTGHPADAASHMAWELPGINQNLSELSVLMAVPGQRAVRTSVRRHLVPDWRSVADRYDGVHLSWAGFITTEGCISDIGAGDVTMLRYWFSERTHWLADVFGDPKAAPAPSLPKDFFPDECAAVDVASDENRRRRDSLALDRLLGR